MWLDIGGRKSLQYSMNGGIGSARAVELKRRIDLLARFGGQGQKAATAGEIAHRLATPDLEELLDFACLEQRTQVVLPDLIGHGEQSRSSSEIGAALGRGVLSPSSPGPLSTIPLENLMESGAESIDGSARENSRHREILRVLLVGVKSVK